MKLIVVRINDNRENTLCKLFIDGKFHCYTLEDTWRPFKIKHATRIPAGTYKIDFRTEGKFYDRYSNHRNQKIRELHKGMLWIKDVPNYQYILIHIGNYARDTSGCLLVGKNYSFNGKERMITQSTNTYLRLYEVVINAMKRKEDITITYLNADRDDT